MTEVLTINPDRAWAEGLNQQEFEREYHRRYGQVDTMPLGSEWIYKTEGKYRTINLPTPEDYTDDRMESEAKVKRDAAEAKKKAGYICKGCGKETKANIGLIAHQKACKLYLNLR